MLLRNRTIGFLGAGNMAEAIMRGLIDRARIPASRIVASDVRAERLEKLRSQLEIETGSSADVLRKASVVIIAVKPQTFTQLSEELASEPVGEQLFVSILAGTRAAKVEAGFSRGDSVPRVIRTMPNTPALVGEGATAVAAGKSATGEDLKLAVELFSAVGVAEVVEEEMLDAVTGLTGSGPAYVFRMIEGLLEAAAQQGLPKDASTRLVKQMVYGAALLARDSEHDPAELRRRVTSPAGTTAAGLTALEEEEFTRVIAAAVDAATRRSRELGQ